MQALSNVFLANDFAQLIGDGDLIVRWHWSDIQRVRPDLDTDQCKKVLAKIAGCADEHLGIDETYIEHHCDEMFPEPDDDQEQINEPPDQETIVQSCYYCGTEFDTGERQMIHVDKHPYCGRCELPEADSFITVAAIENNKCVTAWMTRFEANRLLMIAANTPLKVLIGQHNHGFPDESVTKTKTAEDICQDFGYPFLKIGDSHE